MVFGLGSFFYNACAGYSGVQNCTDLLWAAYSVVLTAYGWYVWFDQPVSLKDHYLNESGLNFKMSEHYKHQRDIWIKHFFKWFYLFQIVSFYAGFVSTIIPFYAFQESSFNTKQSG